VEVAERRALRGLQVQVGQRPGVEAAVGQRRIDLQELPGRLTTLPLVVFAELAVAGVDDAVGIVQREEAVAADRQVERRGRSS
jgi:hypothetical protein